MVEIQLTVSERQQPVVIRVPGEKVKIILPMDAHTDELLAYLKTELSPEELRSFINLWSEDNHPRVYEKVNDYLTIKEQQ